MGDSELRPPCYEVLEWIVSQPNAGGFERSAARTVMTHGLTGAYQEEVLADACEASGTCATCEYSDECGIGDVDRPVPAHRGNDPGGSATSARWTELLGDARTK